MRAAYALLGLLFIALIGGALYAISGTDGARDTPEESGAYLNSDTMAELSLTSTAFTDDGTIPPRYTCDGENTTPPLSFSGVPEGAKSLAFIMDDPDIPREVQESAGIEVFDHWVAFNIPPETSGVAEGEEPSGTAGANSGGGLGYTGPCPPAQYEPTEHRYIFRLYALDTELDLPEGASKTALERAMAGHIIAETALTGVYERQ